VKAYTTRVGGGPFPTELVDATGAHLASRGQEFGVTTGRPRRCGWFDAVSLKRAMFNNSVSGLCITKLDVLDGLDEIRLCVGYRCGGQELTLPPAGAAALDGGAPGDGALPRRAGTGVGLRGGAG